MRAEGSAAPIELLTIGEGPDLYARFGHAAIRVGDTVYNYGYTDFANTQLFFDFIRGRALFWGERDNYDATIALYSDSDRTIARQPLNLSPEQRRRLLRVLGDVDRRYVYHHFEDNCATRLRDVLDSALGGKLGTTLRGRPAPLLAQMKPPLTFRSFARRGFAGQIGVLTAIALFVGRRVDRRMDAWQAGFLPELLQATLQEMTIGGRKLLGKATIAYQRRGPAPGGGASPDAGVTLLWWISAALLVSLILSLVLLRRRNFRSAATILFTCALLQFLLGSILWLLAIIASVPELARNEWALLFWPTDLLLVLFAISLWRGRAFRRRLVDRYLSLRLAGLVIFALLQLAGVLVQRPLVVPVMATLLVLGPWASMRLLPPPPLTSSEPAS